MVVYAPQRQVAVWRIGPANRQAQTALLDIGLLATEPLHAWLGFVNAVGSSASDSVYLEV